MNRFWSSTTRSITPYVPGEQPREKEYIKLNTNENPYPPSPKVIEAISLEANEGVRLYPDPEATGLKEAIAHFYGVQPNEVFVGNGSDEVLAFCFPAFFNPGELISFPEVTYSFYPVYAGLFQVRCRTIAMEADFSVRLDRFPEGLRGILLANPNAPTGIAVEAEQIEKLLQRVPNTLVIVDEAYAHFGAESAVGLIPRYDNLLIVHTMSKSRSLAGLRVGYAMGQAPLIEGLERVRNSFNSYTLDRIAQKAAVAAVNDRAWLERNCRRIVQTRENIRNTLLAMGFRVLPSQANFLFISHPEFSGAELFSRLKQQGILVRHFDKPGIEDWLRVSVGTDEEMSVFIEKLKRIMI